MNHPFAKPPAVFDGLLGMQDWYVNNIRDYCRAHDSNQTDYRREGCFAEAERNHLARFAPSFSETDIEDYGSLKNFCDYYDSLHKKYCPYAVYEPELAYQSYADIESKLAKAEEIEEAIETLGLDEIHHGINAVNSPKVMINTDDLLIFDSSIDEEYQHLYDAGTLTAEHLDEIRCWGISNRIEK